MTARPLVLLALAACASPPPDPAQLQRETFEALDVDLDERVEAVEFVDRVFAEMFEAFDADGDESVEFGEWMHRGNENDAAQLFAVLDVDRDGRLDYVEFAMVPIRRAVVLNVFDTMDRNGDGALDHQELGIGPPPPAEEAPDPVEAPVAGAARPGLRGHGGDVLHIWEGELASGLVGRLLGYRVEEGAEAVVVNIPNDDGSFTPVYLVQVEARWRGPRRDVYGAIPSVLQLRGTYGR